MSSELTTAAIESAITQLMQEKNSSVSVADICKFLGKDDSDVELKKRLIHFLLGDETLYSIDDVHFLKRCDFFNGRKFIIVPTEREISENILYIGHRFQTFMNPEVFPSEITLKYGRRNIAKILRKESLQELFLYHMLMGAEQISDFFIGEDENNANWKTKGGYAAEIRLNVLDMKEFYAAESMQKNDALLLTVKNYDKGFFQVSKLAAADRNEQEISKWCHDFEDAINEVFDKYETYLDLPEQLKMAYFIGENKFFGKKSASLDEFICNAEGVEIVFDSDHTVLVPRNDENDSFSAGIPEGISVSAGESSSLGAILKSIGSSLTETEIDSYILESCFDRDKDFTSFLNKVFDFDKLNFADEAQKTVFLNFVEDRFENFSGKYNRFNDEEKAPLRSRILELVTARNDFFNYLKTMEIEESKIPQQEMKKIAMGSLNLNQLLDMLNDERHDLAEEDKDAIFEAVETAEDILNDAMEVIEMTLKI